MTFKNNKFKTIYSRSNFNNNNNKTYKVNNKYRFYQIKIRS